MQADYRATAYLAYNRMLDGVTIPLPPMALVDKFAVFVEQTHKSKLCGEVEVAA